MHQIYINCPLSENIHLQVGVITSFTRNGVTCASEVDLLKTNNNNI